MPLSRIVYLSDATQRMTHAELEAMVSQSRTNNAAQGISGLLLHSCGHFMQVLEGDDLILSTLYAKIARDPRHTNVRTLIHKPVDSRLFPDWGMQLANTDQMKAIDHDAIDRILIRLRLSSGDDAAIQTQALNLLQEFRQQLMSKAA